MSQTTITSFQDVIFEREGLIRKLFRQFKGTILNFKTEGIDNSLDYKTLPYTVVRILIIQMEENKSIYALSDNSDGISSNYWSKYVHSIDAHLNPKGKKGKFGEGIKIAGLSAFSPLDVNIEKKELVTTTRAINEEEKHALFTATYEPPTFASSETEIPDWLKNHQTLIHLNEEHGTTQIILGKSCVIETLVKDLQRQFDLALRNDILELTIEIYKTNFDPSNFIAGIEIKELDYGEKQFDKWNAKGSIIPVIAFIAPQNDTGDSQGSTNYYVNGSLSHHERTRRDDVICEVDMTSSQIFIDGILSTKDGVTDTCREKIVLPIEKQLHKKYKDRETHAESTKAQDITDEIIKDFNKKGSKGKFGGGSKGVKVKNKWHIKSLFECQEQDFVHHKPTYGTIVPSGNMSENGKYSWLVNGSEEQNIGIQCPKCGSANVLFQKRFENKKHSNLIVDHRAEGITSDFVRFSKTDVIHITFNSDHEYHKKTDMETKSIQKERYLDFIVLIVNHLESNPNADSQKFFEDYQLKKFIFEKNRMARMKQQAQP